MDNNEYLILEEDVGESIPEGAEIIDCLSGRVITELEPHYEYIDNGNLGNDVTYYSGLREVQKLEPNKIVYKIKKDIYKEHNLIKKKLKKELITIENEISEKEKDLDSINDKIDNYYLKSEQSWIGKLFLKN